MCLDPNQLHMIVEQHLEKHHESLEKLINLRFKHVESTLEGVNLRLDKINGRVGKSEDLIRDIQYLDKARETTCPWKSDIKVLKEDFLRDITITEFLKEQEIEKQKIEDAKEKRSIARERKTRTIVAIVGSIVTVATFLINYFL